MPTVGGPNPDDWLVTLATQGSASRAFMPGTSPSDPWPRQRIDDEGWEVWEARIDGVPKTMITAPGVREEYHARIAGEVGTGSNAGGGSRGGGGASAMHAVQVGQPAITGGGQGFQIGAAQVGVVLPTRAGEWKGIDSITPDNKQQDTSPRSVNWDAAGKLGSRSIRRGWARFADDAGTVNDGATASSTITCVAKASFTASSDYIVFRIANGTTRAFWFDTTGADTEPTGSAAADASTTVNISGATSAADVAALLTTAISGASIGITPTDNLNGTIALAITASGRLFYAEENVTNASFLLPQFTVSGAPINSDYRGLSICAIPASGPNADQLLLAFHDVDVDIGTNTSGQQPTSLHLVSTGPLTPRPKSLVGCVGPTLTLSDQGSQVLRVTAVYTNLFPAAAAELMEGSVIGIIIRIVQNVSGGTPRYALDPDGEDGTGSTYFAVSAVDQNRVSWNGASTTYDMTVTAGKAWVTVWAVGRDGLSEPSFASKTVA